MRSWIPLKSVTHGRQTCTATDTFSEAGHHRFPWPVPNYTAWYRRCKQHAQGCYAKVERPRIKPTTLLSREPNSLTITALGKGGGQRVNTGAAKLYLTSCHRCAHNSSHTYTCRSKLAVHRSCVKRQYERREKTCQITFPHTRPCYAKSSYRSVDPRPYTWKRPPGRPRTKWTDQLRRDNNNMFPLRLCGGKPLVAVPPERRYGPSRLGVNDDDDKTDSTEPLIAPRRQGRSLGTGLPPARPTSRRRHCVFDRSVRLRVPGGVILAVDSNP